MIQLSDKVKHWFEENWPEIKDIDSLSLQELKTLRDDVANKRQVLATMEWGTKLIANAGYGACANPGFYFYNVSLAGDITGECRELTKFMWNRLEKFFHEDIWERKDIWKDLDIDLNESKKEWYQNRHISVYSDTDSTIYSSMLSLLDNNNNIQLYSIGDFYNMLLNNDFVFFSDKGHEIINIDNNYKCLNYKDGELYYAPIKRIFRHKVSKSQFKIKTISNKEIIVTGDHSCIVFRNGKQFTIKAKDIDKYTDKILSIIENTKYIIEDIESIEQLEDFDNEYVYDIEVDDDTHTFIANDILVHNSVYVEYGDILKCMTEDWQSRYPTVDDKIKWIAKFNEEFLDKQNNEWLDEMYGKRHVKNVHAFEMEAINQVQINLAKKKYLKATKWNKGTLYDHAKTKGTGIELIKSTTPPIARKILTDLVNLLMYDYAKMNHSDFVWFFRDKLGEAKKIFYAASVDELSQSIGVNGYKKYVLNDESALEFNKGATPGVKGCALYNYLAHKNGHDDKRIYSGKMKYYNIRISAKETSFFAYPFGECPEWAPKMDMGTQWDKTIIQPINRFLEVMDIPKADREGIQVSLFDL